MLLNCILLCSWERLTTLALVSNLSNLTISIGKCQPYLAFWLMENVPYLAKQKRKANSTLRESKHEA